MNEERRCTHIRAMVIDDEEECLSVFTDRRLLRERQQGDKRSV